MKKQKLMKHKEVMSKIFNELRKVISFSINLIYDNNSFKAKNSLTQSL